MKNGELTTVAEQLYLQLGSRVKLLVTVRAKEMLLRYLFIHIKTCVCDREREREQWTVDSGQWTVDSGQWTVDSGQWTVDSRKWRDIRH